MESTGYEGVIAAVMAILGIVIVVGLIVSIIMIIARWKIFTKAGEEGWKAIIPKNIIPIPKPVSFPND